MNDFINLKQVLKELDDKIASLYDTLTFLKTSSDTLLDYMIEFNQLKKDCHKENTKLIVETEEEIKEATSYIKTLPETIVKYEHMISEFEQLRNEIYQKLC